MAAGWKLFAAFITWHSRLLPGTSCHKILFVLTFLAFEWLHCINAVQCALPVYAPERWLEGKILRGQCCHFGFELTAYYSIWSFISVDFYSLGNKVCLSKVEKGVHHGARLIFSEQSLDPNIIAFSASSIRCFILCLGSSLHLQHSS